MEEMNTPRISPVFTADPKFEIRTQRACLLGCSSDKNSYPRLIERFKGIEGQKFEI